MKLIQQIEAEQFKTDRADFGVGDDVRVHTRIKEGDKERVQVFAGLVIARKGRGMNEQFTVRRISYGEGVERSFPRHSNTIDKIEVTSRGRVRRAKLYYLRGRTGKSALTVKPSLKQQPKGKTVSKTKKKTAAATE